MGRGEKLSGLTAEQCENLFEVLYRVQKTSKFLVKITEAPHYRRYVAQHEWHEDNAPEPPRRGHPDGHPGIGSPHGPGDGGNLPRQLIRTEGPGHSIGLATQGVNAGKGFLFISHRGDIFPSGFLPITAGNVREEEPGRGLS